MSNTQLLYFQELSNKNIKVMLVESENVANYSIQEIIINVWVKVAEKNIEKMAPKNVQLMNVHTFQSIAQLHSQFLQDRDGFNQVEQKSCIQKDNYLNHYQKVQRKLSKLDKLNQLPNISGMKSKLSKYKDSKRTTKNVFTDNQPSGNQSKVTSQRTKDQKNNNKFISLDTLDIRVSNNGVNKNQETNRRIEALRTKIVYTEELKKKQETQLQTNQVKNLQRKQVLLKKQKQVQRFTYDYDGEFFASKLSNPQNTLGSAAKIKSQFQKQTPKNAKKQKMKPLFTSIVNDKIEERHRKLVTQQLQNQNNKKLYKQSLASMLANSLSHDEDVSEGISIKETYSNFCKSKPLKHKITLSEFKNEIANKKFKQFRFKPVKLTTQTDNVNVVNRISSYKSQQFFLENNRNRNHTTDQIQHSQKIPSIRNNIRYKTIFSSEHNSILSNSKYSAASSKKIKQGAIKVSNPSLYQTFCQESLA